MALKTIKEEWQGFASMVIPSASPGEVQYDEMKKAFFAGAWAVVTSLEEMGEPHISEFQAIKHLEAIKSECSEFSKELMREYRERN